MSRRSGNSDWSHHESFLSCSFEIFVLYLVFICFVRCNARILSWLRNLRNTGVSWQFDDGHADSDSYPDPNTHADSDSYPNTHADSDSYPNTHADSNPNTYADSHTCANTHAHTYARTARSGRSGVRGESRLFERDRELG